GRPVERDRHPGRDRHAARHVHDRDHRQRRRDRADARDAAQSRCRGGADRGPGPARQRDRRLYGDRPGGGQHPQRIPVRLTASEVKLMTLPLADLRTLEAAESATAPATVVTRAAEILSAQNLLTEAQLAGGMALLGQWKLTSDPLFQWMGYYDELAMFGLLNDP